MRFRLVETITQNNKIYKKIQEIISNEYNGKKYEDLSDSEKRKVVDKAIEEFDTRNVLKPSKTVYTNELLENGIDERENPFVTFMENIKIALPTTIIKVLIDKTHKESGKYKIDPRRDDFIYDKRLYNKMDSTGDIKDTIYKLNALAYVNNEKVEKDGRRVVVADLIGKSVERIKQMLSGIEIESFDFNMLEAIIKYLDSIKETKEWAQELAKNQAKLKNYNATERTTFLNKLVELLGKDNISDERKTIINSIQSNETMWKSFLDYGLDKINPNVFLKNLENTLDNIGKNEKDKQLKTFFKERHPDKEITKALIENILPSIEEYKELSKEDKAKYKQELKNQIALYKEDENVKDLTPLGKILSQKGLKATDVDRVFLNWLGEMVIKNNTQVPQDIEDQETKTQQQPISSKKVNDFIPQDGTNIGKFILENILATTEKFQNLNTQDKNLYRKALEDAISNYGLAFARDPANGQINARATELGKLLEKPATEEEIGNIIFEWLKGLVEGNQSKNESLKKPNQKIIKRRTNKPNFDYNGDSI